MKKTDQKSKKTTANPLQTGKNKVELTSVTWYKNPVFLMKLTLFIFAFVLYGNTMKNGYSLDDLYVTYNNPVVNKGIEAIPYILSTRYINVNAEEGGTMNFGYRPLAKVMFAIEHQLFGEDPGTSHAINIILYAVSLLVLFSVLRKLLHKYNIWLPFLITLLWAAHPVHTEVVASLKNREEIISFLFALLAFRSFINYTNKNSVIALVAGTLLFILSGLAKPSTIPLLLAIPFSLYFFLNTKITKPLIVAFCMAAISVITIVLLKTYLPESNRPVLFFENPLLFEKNFIAKVATGMYGLLIYIKLLVYPHPLLFYYGYNTIPIVGLGNIWVLLSIVIHTGLLIFAIYKFRERHLLSYAIFFYLIVISMYSNIVKQPAGIIAERFLYIASLGFSIALAFFIFYLAKTNLSAPVNKRNAVKLLALALIVLIPFTGRTIVRNKDWNSQLSLFAHDIKYLNNSAKANYIYATTLKSNLIERLNAGNQNGTENQVAAITQLLRQTVKVYPGYFEAWNSLGEIQAMMKNDYDSALFYFKKASEAKPSFAAAWFNQGYAYQLKNEFDPAIQSYLKAIKLDSTDVKAMSNLAYCFSHTGRTNEAIVLNKQMISMHPKMELPYMNMAMQYYKIGDTLNAVKTLEQLMIHKPDAKKAAGFLSRYYGSIGDSLRATQYWAIFNKNE